jgi:hypothetical protein
MQRPQRGCKCGKTSATFCYCHQIICVVLGCSSQDGSSSSTKFELAWTPKPQVSACSEYFTRQQSLHGRPNRKFLPAVSISPGSNPTAFAAFSLFCRRADRQSYQAHLSDSQSHQSSWTASSSSWSKTGQMGTLCMSQRAAACVAAYVVLSLC